MENESRAGENAQPRRGADGRRYSSTRERVLREVEARGSASLADLVAATGLHENTLREHLERLRQDGRLRRVRAEVRGRGRPAWRWSAPPADAIDPYAGLALALADSLAATAPDPVGIARAAGEQWGDRIAAQHPDAIGAPRTIVLDVMREQGFAPDDEGAEILLHRCPLLAAAARRADVVCAVHEGMIAGILRSRDATADATLLPFHTDGACALRIRTAS
ncbi:helix-turn-helix transcriptional regulator [Microbacterium sp. USHLN186]|uniref:helix-turn-helix transcriptional regulator n=1 Tax=Microbacterium sp. USHLN186 TaxID=3081286 RepID=UPI0030164E4C